MKDFFKTIAAWLRITVKPSTIAPMLEMVDRVAAEFGLSKQVYHPDPLHWADGATIYYVCSTEIGKVVLCFIDTIERMQVRSASSSIESSASLLDRMVHG